MILSVVMGGGGGGVEVCVCVYYSSRSVSITPRVKWPGSADTPRGPASLLTDVVSVTRTKVAFPGQGLDQLHTSGFFHIVSHRDAKLLPAVPLRVKETG